MTTDTDNYNEYFTNLDKWPRWPVAVSINRNNPAPLDANSLFRSYEDAKAYATRDTEYLKTNEIFDNSYVGQIISVYEPPVIDAETNEEISPVSVKVYKVVPSSINTDCLVQLDADIPHATEHEYGAVKLYKGTDLVNNGTGEDWNDNRVPTVAAIVNAFDDYTTDELVYT